MRINVPLVKFESKVPVIKLKLGDEDFYALLDTGSESTLLDRKLQENKNIKKKELEHEMTFVGLNGATEQNKLAILTGEFLHGKHKIRISGLSTDLSSVSNHFKDSYGSDVVISAVLGCDFLEGYCANIDMEEHFVGLFL
jgi:hypothetical protein